MSEFRESLVKLDIRSAGVRAYTLLVAASAAKRTRAIGMNVTFTGGVQRSLGASDDTQHQQTKNAPFGLVGAPEQFR